MPPATGVRSVTSTEARQAAPARYWRADATPPWWGTRPGGAGTAPLLLLLPLLLRPASPPTTSNPWLSSSWRSTGSARWRAASNWAS